MHLCWRILWQKDVILKLVTDVGISADDGGQRLLLHDTEHFLGLIALVAKTVTVTQTHEQVGE
jgi:hypothetical protein